MQSWSALPRPRVRVHLYLLCEQIYVYREPDTVQLAVGVLTSIVLMLIIGIKLKLFSNREEAPNINFSGAPLFILALVVHLDASIRGWMIGTDHQWPFYFELVAITPRKFPGAPIEI